MKQQVSDFLYLSPLPPLLLNPLEICSFYFFKYHFHFFKHHFHVFQRPLSLSSKVQAVSWQCALEEAARIKFPFTLAACPTLNSLTAATTEVGENMREHLIKYNYHAIFFRCFIMPPPFYMFYHATSLLYVLSCHLPFWCLDGFWKFLAFKMSNWHVEMIGVSLYQCLFLHNKNILM